MNPRGQRFSSFFSTFANPFLVISFITLSHFLFDKSDAKNEIVKIEFERPEEQSKIVFPPLSENHYSSEGKPVEKRKMGFKNDGIKNMVIIVEKLNPQPIEKASGWVNPDSPPSP